MVRQIRVAHLIAVAFLAGLVGLLAFEAVQTVHNDHSQPTAAQVALAYAQKLSRGARTPATSSPSSSPRSSPITKGADYHVVAASLEGPYVRVLLQAGSERHPSVAVDLQYGQDGWAVRDLVPPGQPPP